MFVAVVAVFVNDRKAQKHKHTHKQNYILVVEMCWLYHIMMIVVVVVVVVVDTILIMAM